MTLYIILEIKLVLLYLEVFPPTHFFYFQNTPALHMVLFLSCFFNFPDVLHISYVTHKFMTHANFLLEQLASNNDRDPNVA